MTGKAARRAWAVVVALAAAATSLTLAARQPVPARSVIAAACERAGWVGDWAMPPSDAGGTPLPAGVTLRQLIYPSLGGSRVRVSFSNAMSPTPVVLGAVTIGTRTQGAAVDPRSMTTLLFAGRRSVTIPPGGGVTSDAAAFSFAALQELTVSSYVSSADPTPSEHRYAEQASYLAGSGNHVADASGAAFTRLPMSGTNVSTFSSVLLLSGLEVRSPPSAGAVVALGDSITDGLLPSSTATNVRWPDELARRLDARGVPLAVVNAGISGNELLADVVPAGRSAQHRFDTDVIAQPGVRTVIVLEGINDLRTGEPVGDIEAGYASLIARAHAAGLRILLATLTPAGSSADEATSGTEKRLLVNIWIRSQRLADGVLDFDAVVADPRDPTRLAGRYDGGDHLHLSPAGYEALADAVPLSLLLPAGCLPG